MIQTKIFRRHYLVTIIILLLFAWAGLSLSRVAMRYIADQNRPQPLVFFAKLVDKIEAGDRVTALARLSDVDGNMGPPLRFTLLSADGQVLYPAGDLRSPLNWATVQKPTDDLKQIMIDREDGPPIEMIRLPGEPKQYLLAEIDHGGRRPPPPFFLYSFGFMVLAIILGAGLALYVLFRNMGEKIAMADSVIDQLQKGNLRARFPITRNDEIGQVMTRFNKMADEIERLVEQLRSVEQSRMALLQELAHDLRTPVASLKNLLETLAYKKSEITVAVQDEFMALSLKEVDYFERLVEDLLLLAQVSEPRYSSASSEVDVAQILKEEIDLVSGQPAFKASHLKIITKFPDQKILSVGDSHLLKRLFRNALNNAISFATSVVQVEVKFDGSTASIRVEDDGPGFTPESLKSFGERRVSRMIGGGPNGRLSVGLGSVIMKKIADVHRGKLVAGNVLGSRAQTRGASLEVYLPRK